MGCIGSRTVGGYRGGRGRARVGSSRSGPPTPSPISLRVPLGTSLGARPARLRSLTFPPCPRGPYIPLFSPLSPRSSRACIPLARFVLSISLQLPSIALPQARSLSPSSLHQPPLFSSVALLYSPVPSPSASRPSSSLCLPQRLLAPVHFWSSPPSKNPQPQSQSQLSFACTPISSPHPPARLHLAWVLCPHLFPSQLPFSVILASPDLLCSRAFSLRGGGGLSLVPGEGNGFHARREWGRAELGWRGKAVERGGGKGLEGPRRVGNPLSGGWSGPGKEPQDLTAPVSGGWRGGAGSLFTFDWGRAQRRLLIRLLPSALPCYRPLTPTPSSHSTLTAQQINPALSQTPQFFPFQLPISPAYTPQ